MLSCHGVVLVLLQGSSLAARDVIRALLASLTGGSAIPQQVRVCRWQSVPHSRSTPVQAQATNRCQRTSMHYCPAEDHAGYHQQHAGRGCDLNAWRLAALCFCSIYILKKNAPHNALTSRQHSICTLNNLLSSVTELHCTCVFSTLSSPRPSSSQH